MSGSFFMSSVVYQEHINRVHQAELASCVTKCLAVLTTLADPEGMLNVHPPFGVHYKNPLTNVERPDENCSGGNSRERFWPLKKVKNEPKSEHLNLF